MRDGKLRCFSDVVSRVIGQETELMSVPQTNIHPLFVSRSQTSPSQVPTSFLSLSWNCPFGKLLQDVVEGELEPGIREDSDDSGSQTSIESAGPFCLVHGHHCVAKVAIDLDNKERLTFQ